jgi:hypothetical protein
MKLDNYLGYDYNGRFFSTYGEILVHHGYVIGIMDGDCVIPWLLLTQAAIDDMMLEIELDCLD